MELSEFNQQYAKHSRSKVSPVREWLTTVADNTPVALPDSILQQVQESTARSQIRDISKEHGKRARTLNLDGTIYVVRSPADEALS